MFPIKILSVIPSYWPAFKYGGPIYSVHNLNKALVKKGIDVTVYTTNVGLEGKVPLNKLVTIDGVKVVYFAFSKFLEFMGTTGWQFSIRMTVALKKNLKTFDIVHITGVWNYPILSAAYYCRKYKKPYIISPRGVLYSKTLGKKYWKKKIYYKLISNRDLKYAAVIHCTAESEVESCISLLGSSNKMVSIPNGIVLSEFEINSSEKILEKKYPLLKNKKKLLFLSRISWKKGMDLLIEAFSLLVRDKDDLYLIIAGSDDDDGYIDKVKTWILDYRLSSKVIFTGRLDGKDKVLALKEADVFVLPSYSENFGMAVAEAMICGTSVVISDKVGICKEVEENNAGIVVKTNAESIFKGVKDLLNNKDLRKRIEENGKKMIKKYYDINKVADKMIEMYEEVLQK